jgi:hypothetical protein
MLQKVKLILCTAILFSSCDYIKTPEDDNALARVNKNYLYQSEVNNRLPDNLSPNDSAAFVQRFINDWAKQELLLSGATQNLNEEKLNQFDKLINQYRSDLYTNAYLEALINKNLDTIVKDSEAKKYFNNYTEAFTLNENLIQFRYVKVNEERGDLKDLIRRLKRFNNADKKVLDSLSIQFKSYALNDSIWVKPNKVLNKLPVITNANSDELLKKSNFLQLKDSLDLYLVQIKNVLNRGDTAPLSYVRPTINQIVVNKRKVDLLRQIESDITKDAIKNKKFEIFN